MPLFVKSFEAVAIDRRIDSGIVESSCIKAETRLAGSENYFVKKRQVNLGVEPLVIDKNCVEGNVQRSLAGFCKVGGELRQTISASGQN